MYESRALGLVTGGDASKVAGLPDGSKAGTMRLVTLSSRDAVGDAIASLQFRDGKWYFIARNVGIPGVMSELWVTDGTRAGTRRYTHVYKGETIYIGSLAFIKGCAVMSGITADNGVYLSVRTFRLNLVTGALTKISEAGVDAVDVGGCAFGPGATQLQLGRTTSEPWITDGTAAETRKIKEIWRGELGSGPQSVQRIAKPLT